MEGRARGVAPIEGPAMVVAFRLFVRVEGLAESREGEHAPGLPPARLGPLRAREQLARPLCPATPRADVGD
jgi:hypothetical protein